MLKCKKIPKQHFPITLNSVCPNKKNKPKGYWNNLENVKKFLNGLQETLNLHTSEDWNNITRSIIIKNGGGTLLHKYSVFELKSLICEEVKIKYLNEPKNNKKPAGYWKNKKNVNKFIKEIKKTYNLNSPEDCNEITSNQILQLNGGPSLLKIYSMFEIKCLLNSSIKTKYVNQLKNCKKESGFWGNKENVEKFLSKIKMKYNLNSPEKWNQITAKDIKNEGGGGLFNTYKMFELKCIGCAEVKEKFNNQPKNNYKSLTFWNDKDNIDHFLREIEQKLNLNSAHDWNKLTISQIRFYGGGGLLKLYTLYEIKCMGCKNFEKAFFPKQRQDSKPENFWDDKDNLHSFIEKLKCKYNLNSISDWNRISDLQIKEFGGSQVLLKFSREDLIRIALGFSQNIPGDMNSGRRSSQRWLFLNIKSLFPNEEIVEDFYHEEITRTTGFAIQFDIFLVNRNIAFEYHGMQHYFDVPSKFAFLELYKYRDNEKESLCKKFGISLIPIPFWWDNNLHSLKNTIVKYFNNNKLSLQ